MHSFSSQSPIEVGNLNLRIYFLLQAPYNVVLRFCFGYAVFFFENVHFSVIVFRSLAVVTCHIVQRMIHEEVNRFVYSQAQNAMRFA